MALLEEASGLESWYPAWSEQRYHLLQVLACSPRSGSQVELCMDRATGAVVVCKRIFSDFLRESPAAYRDMNPQEVNDPWKEFALARSLGTPAHHMMQGVCRCRGAFITVEGDGMLLLEYVNGGDILSQVVDDHPGPEREAKVWPLIKSLITIVCELHARDIAHGEVTLENILVRKTECTDLVLIDLAMAVTGNLRRARGIRGKPSYQAPEMHTELTYDARAADLFACGAVAYTLAVGNYPWNSTRPNIDPAFGFFSRRGIPSLLARRLLVFDGKRVPLAQLISPRLQQLMSTLLNIEPAARFAALRVFGITADEALPTKAPGHDDMNPDNVLQSDEAAGA